MPNLLSSISIRNLVATVFLIEESLIAASLAIKAVSLKSVAVAAVFHTVVFNVNALTGMFTS